MNYPRLTVLIKHVLLAVAQIWRLLGAIFFISHVMSHMISHVMSHMTQPPPVNYEHILCPVTANQKQF